MILILTRKDDDHTFFVTERLKQKGAPFICFETAEFPNKITTSLTYNATAERHLLEIDGVSLDLRDVHAVWNRRPAAPIPAESLSEIDKAFVKQESQYFLHSLWRMLPHAFWVNRFWNNVNADYKPYQLTIARECGFNIPKTLITNDPKSALSFCETAGPNIIYKCLTSHGRILDDGTGRALFTAPITLQHLLAHGDQIKLAPCIFQEYVEKQVELRVTVFGRCIYAVEIDSQSQEFSKTDWRKPSGDNRNSYHVPQRRVTLPRIVEDQIFTYMDRLGLVFGCWDFILTPAGKLVFLEVNPNGQWYWLEQVTGAPMLETFTDMLMKGRPPDRADPIDRYPTLTIV